MDRANGIGYAPGSDRQTGARPAGRVLRKKERAMYTNIENRLERIRWNLAEVRYWVSQAEILSDMDGIVDKLCAVQRYLSRAVAEAESKDEEDAVIGS